MLLRDLEHQLIELLAPLKAKNATARGAAVKHVVPWVADDSPDPDDDEIARRLEGLDSAVLVTLAGSEATKTTGRAKVQEQVTCLLTIYVSNKSAQETSTRGDARRVGIYDLIDLVRARVENTPVVDQPGSRYRFQGHRRIGYSRGRLAWQVEYVAQVESRFDPESSTESYRRLLGHLNDPASATNPRLVIEREDL